MKITIDVPESGENFPSIRQLRRAYAIKLLEGGCSIVLTAQILGITRPTLYAWTAAPVAAPAEEGSQ